MKMRRSRAASRVTGNTLAVGIGTGFDTGLGQHDAPGQPTPMTERGPPACIRVSVEQKRQHCGGKRFGTLHVRKMCGLEHYKAGVLTLVGEPLAV